MKKCITIPFLLVLSFLIGSCQKEKQEVLSEDEARSLGRNSELSDLVQRAAMHDGSTDDGFDGSPCFSISFPYKVYIEGTEIRVTSNSDVRAVLERIERLGLDQFEFHFPLTLTLGNYERITVSNILELIQYQRNCKIEIAANLVPITCIEIVFPLRVLTYNTNTQMTSSATLSNKQQLFVFLNNKKLGEVLNFEYPITLIFEGDTVLKVTDSSGFQNALEMCNN